jgi:hypothetical protein
MCCSFRSTVFAPLRLASIFASSDSPMLSIFTRVKALFVDYEDGEAWRAHSSNFHMMMDDVVKPDCGIRTMMNRDWSSISVISSSGIRIDGFIQAIALF